jgi:hypothetical protein
MVVTVKAVATIKFSHDSFSPQGADNAEVKKLSLNLLFV